MINVYLNTNTFDDCIDRNLITTNKNDAKILLVGGKKINIDEFPNLVGVFKVGIGVDNIPFDELKKRNIVFGGPSELTREYIYEETACFTCGLIFHMIYRKSGTMNPWNKYSRTHIGNKNLLVVGTGNIGNRVVDKMEKFMDVDSFDLLENKPMDLYKKIPYADIISLHIPLTQENQGFWNNKKIMLMKPGSTIINTARGGLVNEDDLYTAIKENNIDAAFDVFWQEPYTGKLMDFYPDGFYATPHVASQSDEFLEMLYHDFQEFVRGF